MIERFALRELVFELPSAALRGGLRAALTSGRYEQAEADAVLAHLVPGDRFLDLGAGMGYLCCLAARVLGAGHVVGVEAGLETIGIARANLALNGFGDVRLRHGAVVADAGAAQVEFGMRPAFWASALRQGADDWPKNAEVIHVPACPIQQILEEVRPTVLSCDIEGAELAVLAQGLTPELRLIVVEIHPAVYGPGGTGQVFAALARQGFVYEPQGSRGAVVVFRRL